MDSAFPDFISRLLAQGEYHGQSHITISPAFARRKLATSLKLESHNFLTKFVQVLVELQAESMTVEVRKTGVCLFGQLVTGSLNLDSVRQALEQPLSRSTTNLALALLSARYCQDGDVLLFDRTSNVMLRSEEEDWIIEDCSSLPEDIPEIHQNGLVVKSAITAAQQKALRTLYLRTCSYAPLQCFWNGKELKAPVGSVGPFLSLWLESDDGPLFRVSLPAEERYQDGRLTTGKARNGFPLLVNPNEVLGGSHQDVSAAYCLPDTLDGRNFLHFICKGVLVNSLEIDDPPMGALGLIATDNDQLSAHELVNFKRRSRQMWREQVRSVVDDYGTLNSPTLLGSLVPQQPELIFGLGWLPLATFLGFLSAGSILANPALPIIIGALTLPPLVVSANPHTNRRWRVESRLQALLVELNRRPLR